MTRLDRMLQGLISAIPEWELLLPPEEVHLLKRRMDGATLQELAAEFGLTKAGVRHRLYGAGCGGVRHGGVLGRLRGLKRKLSMAG